MDTNSAPVGDAGQERFLRSIGLFGAGATLAVGTALLHGASAADLAPPAGATALWVGDRDAQRVYALDRDLLLTRRIPVSWPIEVESCTDGGLWVLRANDGTDFGGFRLDRFARSGELVTEVALAHAASLATLARDDALLIESDVGSRAATRALRFEREGSLHTVLERPGLSCIASSHGSVAVGTVAGRVLRVDPEHPGVVQGAVDLGGSIGDLACGPTDGSFWALDVGVPRRLFLLDAELCVSWSVTIGIDALHLAPVPGAERVWLVDAGEPALRRFGPRGALELDLRGLPLRGCDRALAWRDEGVLVAAPGALLHLDQFGRLAAGQGGFNQLVDLDRAP